MSSSVQARAVVQEGQNFVERTVTLPALSATQVLVKVHYAALNPTDVLAFALCAFGNGAVLGCDFSGVVERVGSEVKNLEIGDKIASFIWGGEVAGLGAYSEYCIAEADLAFKVPGNITLEQAATIPLAATTAWVALYSSQCLGLKPSEHKSNVLVIGGSSTVGSFASQIASTSQIPIIATSSNRNRDAVLQNGAKQVFDYNASDHTSQIRDADLGIDHVFDTIGSPDSTKVVAEVLGDRKSRMVTVRPGKVNTENLPKNIEVTDVFVFTCFPKEHSYRGKGFWPINDENISQGKTCFTSLGPMIEKDQLRPRPVNSMGTLSPDSLTKAFQLVRDKKVSNEKLCFTVADAAGL